MEAGYYYSRDGQRFGPVPVSQLKQLAVSGQLRPTDLIWTQGMPNWESASKSQGLFPPGAPIQGASPSQPQAPSPPPLEPANTRSAGDNARQLGMQAREAAVAAGADALHALKALAKNPVGGMREAHDLLGPSRAMAVGIVFAVVFYLCCLIGGRILIGGWFAQLGGLGFSFYLKLAFIGLVPIAGTIGGCTAARAMFRGQGSIQSDIFVAGAALLPAGIGILLTSLLGMLNAEVSMVTNVFATTTSVLMLYSGFTTVQKISEAAATLAVPLVLIVDFVVLDVIIRAMASPI